MGLTVHFEVLNQFGTPLMYSATLANRPAAGIAGRIFFRTDTPFGIYRDTGTIWDLIAIGGGTVDTNIYNTDGTLTANRTVSSGGFGLTFNPATVFDTTLTAANNASSLALFGLNRLSYAAAFSANNIGAIYGGTSAFALQTFAGSATFANSNIASGGSSVNSVDFSTGGSTITMTQATGLRVMAGQINMFQYQGTNSGTITHAAISQNLGFYRPTAATGILTITNAYGHLINDLNDYGAGFTFTNRWGIYQAGTSDINYFAANCLIGSNISTGEKLQVTGTSKFTNTINGTGAVFSSTLTANFLTSTSSFGFTIGDLVNTNRISFGNLANTFSLTNSINALCNLQAYDGLFFHRIGINATPAVAIQAAISSGETFVTQLTTSDFVSSTLGTRILIGFGASTGNTYSEIRTNGGGGLTNTSLVLNANGGNLLVGTTTDAGQKLYLNGSFRIDGQTSGSAGGSSGQHLIINCDGTSYKIALLNT